MMKTNTKRTILSPRSISACLNWPVKSSRQEQMQIALTCSHQKKNSWRPFKWTHPHNGGVPRAGWIYGLGSEWHNVWEPNWGAVKWRLRTLQAACCCSLGCYKADHHHYSPLLGKCLTNAALQAWAQTGKKKKKKNSRWKFKSEKYLIS